MVNFLVVYYWFDKDFNFMFSVGGVLNCLNLKFNEVVGKSMKDLYCYVLEIIEGYQVLIEGKDNVFLIKVFIIEEEFFFDMCVIFDVKK